MNEFSKELMMWYLVVSIKSVGVILVKMTLEQRGFPSSSIFFLTVFILQSPLASKMCKSNVKRKQKQKGKNKGKRTISKRCGEKKWQPTPVFLPGEFHGQRSLEGYSPSGCKELDTTEQLNRSTSLAARPQISEYCLGSQIYSLMTPGWLPPFSN